MNPEMLQLNTRVETPEGSGRVMPFFDEDPDTVVCPGPDGDIWCRVKMDTGDKLLEVKFKNIKLMSYE